MCGVLISQCHLHCLPSSYSIKIYLNSLTVISWDVVGSEEVFVIIHNIDGSMLRSKKVGLCCMLHLHIMYLYCRYLVMVVWVAVH